MANVSADPPVEQSSQPKSIWLMAMFFTYPCACTQLSVPRMLTVPDVSLANVPVPPEPSSEKMISPPAPPNW